MYLLFFPPKNLLRKKTTLFSLENLSYQNIEALTTFQLNLTVDRMDTLVALYKSCLNRDNKNSNSFN